MTYDYGGWIKIWNDDGDDFVTACCEEWEMDEKTSPTIEDLPADTRYSYNLDEWKRPITIKSVFFNSYSKWLQFRKFIRINNTDGLKLEIQYSDEDELVASAGAATGETGSDPNRVTWDAEQDLSGVEAGDIVVITNGTDDNGEFYIETVSDPNYVEVYSGYDDFNAETDINASVKDAKYVDLLATSDDPDGEDYTNATTKLEVYIESGGMRGIGKMYRGNSSYWSIKQISFRQRSST